MGKGSWKCTICGKYWHPDIAPLGHYWGDPTCASPAKCKRCGAINPESSPTNSHDWIAATCMEKKHCKACGLTQGDLSDHKWNAAKCTERRRCTVCRTLDTIKSWEMSILSRIPNAMSVASAKTAAHSIRLMEPFTILLQAIIALNMATVHVAQPQTLLLALIYGS